MPEIYIEKDKSVIVTINMFNYIPSVTMNAEIHQNYPGCPIKGKLIEGQLYMQVYTTHI